MLLLPFSRIIIFENLIKIKCALAHTRIRKIGSQVINMWNTHIYNQINQIKAAALKKKTTIFLWISFDYE